MSGYPRHLLPLDFLARAEEFFSAFRKLPPGRPPDWPRYFLLCHAIELALKAYLLWRGETAHTLKRSPFGHKLKELLKTTTNQGLPIGLLALSELEHLDEAHSNFWPRYPKEDGKPVFVIDPLEPYVAELLVAVAAAIRGGIVR